MKIAVNTRFLLGSRLEGLGRFTFETMKRVVVNRPNDTFYFIFDRPYHNKFVFAPNVIPLVAFPPARHPFLWYIWFEYSLPLLFSRIHPDLFISTDGFLSLRSEVPQIAVMHDLNFEHYPDDFQGLTKQYYHHYFPKYARKARRIITVSEYSKRDLIQTYGMDPERIDVAYNAPNMHYKPLTPEQKDVAKAKFTGGCVYFLYLGALLPRKNIPGLLLAFERFRTMCTGTVKLLIAGATMFGIQKMESVYKNMKYKDDVIFTGYLSDADVSLALGGALALTYVSYFEGFGIPVIEAMYADVPVITSNVTSMPEIAGDAALLVDPFSVESMAHAMLKIYTGENVRISLIQKGRIQRELFSWDKTAETVWAAVEKSLK